MKIFDEAVAALRDADVMFKVEPMKNPSCSLGVANEPDDMTLPFIDGTRLRYKYSQCLRYEVV